MPRCAGRRPRTLLCALGEMHLQRAYYHCAACKQGFFPRDRAWGVADSYLSPGVQRMVCVVGAAVSFAEGADLLRELAGLKVSARQVERDAERLGAQAARFECEDSAAPAAAIADECFPNAIQILDKFHAKEHVHEVAKAVFGAGTDLAQQWARQRCQEMDQGQINTLIAAIVHGCTGAARARDGRERPSLNNPRARNWPAPAPATSPPIASA